MDIKVRVEEKKGLSFRTWKAENLSEMLPYPGTSEVCSVRPLKYLRTISIVFRAKCEILYQ